MTKPAEQNCIEIIKPYVRALEAPGMPPVQLMGGVGSVALQKEGTVILPDEKRIIAPPGLALSNYRDDGNLRDLDSLVLSSSPDDIARVEQAARVMGGALLAETFSLHDYQQLASVMDRPLGFEAFKMFVSDRYTLGERTVVPERTEVRRVLFPFSVPIDPEALEPWTLEIRDVDRLDIMEIPVPAPGAVILNYLTRSISGLRGKDADKVEAVGRSVFAKAPKTLDWIVDGPGASQYDFARIMHTLRESSRKPQPLVVGDKLEINSIGFENLMDHPAFMLKDEDPKIQKRALRVAKIKSRGLRTGESMSFVVTLFQRYIEPRIKSITHNT